MTNYYMTTEAYEEKMKEDQKIIDKLNAGELSFDEGEEQLQELWGLGKRDEEIKEEKKQVKTE